MSFPIDTIKEQLKEVVQEWISLGQLQQGEFFVVGCSTSEVAGERIGTNGNLEIAKVIFEELMTLKEHTGIHLAFQCCEHLNRSLVVTRDAAKQHQLQEVSAIPVPKAGGSMASYAYQQMEDAVLVEQIQAHAGMDIGDTFIGMHLMPVVIPVRMKINSIGSAHLTCATTRPKLIGGARAVYTKEAAQSELCD